MAFQCGFFNSINGDRKYNADQMGYPYNKIISDGVMATPTPETSTQLQVVSDSGMNILVKQGTGMFFNKWCILDSDTSYTIAGANVVNPRIDSMIVKIDYTNRIGTLEYRNGIADATPTPPTLVRTTRIKEYRLANILVRPNVQEITQSDITDTRPSADCGWVSNLLADSDITATYAQWQAQFMDWFNNVRLTLSTVTAITSFTSRYTTLQADVTTIPIQISRFNSVLDILQVYINGMICIENVDYTITDNEYIELARPLYTGTTVSFIVYKSVDGTEAESVVSQVNDLYERVDGLEIHDAEIESDINNLIELLPTSQTGAVEVSVSADGNVLSSFTALGLGIHTLFSAAGATNAPSSSGVWQYIGHITGTNAGYIIGLNNDGDVYVNNLATTWQGWTPITNQRTPLWTGALYMNDSQTITPSKTLTECKNGWVLVWSGYQNGAAMENRITTQIIPRLSADGNYPAGTLYYHVIPQAITTTQNTAVVCKAIYVSRHQISGHAANGVSPATGYVLRAIYEY